MRLRIRHETTYTYEHPAKRAIENLRLTPRAHDGQFLLDWRIDVDHDCRLTAGTDALGNLTHRFTIDAPFDRLGIIAEGTVETLDTGGILRGHPEKLPPDVFLRATALTTPDPAIRGFAEAVKAPPRSLSAMHEIMDRIREHMTFDVDATNTGTSAAEAFRLRHGVCQDFAHVFIAAARHVATPARYASGYMRRVDGLNEQDAGHAWAEALIDDLGWVGFDPANGISPTEAYVRLAIGLDYLGAAPVRGVRFAGQGEKLSVHVSVAEAPAGRR
jgi:transglutaminase-like putative cysteine protease